MRGTTYIQWSKSYKTSILRVKAVTLQHLNYHRISKKLFVICILSLMYMVAKKEVCVSESLHYSLNSNEFNSVTKQAKSL